MTIAITGATGALGRLTIAALKSRLSADQIVALARSPEKAADLGVTVHAFDYDRPETLEPALAGVDKLLLISGNEVGSRAAQHRAVIAAAKAAGVKKVAAKKKPAARKKKAAPVALPATPAPLI